MTTAAMLSILTFAVGVLLGITIDEIRIQWRKDNEEDEDLL